MKILQEIFQFNLVDGIDTRQLWRRYALGLGLILTLLIGAHTASYWAIEAAASDAQVINDSGRQRMLSQRILYFAAANSMNSGPASQAMHDAIDLFERSHNALTSNPTLSDRMRELYFGGDNEVSLDGMVRQYVLDARAIAGESLGVIEKSAAFHRMEEVGLGALLNSLNEAVQIYENEARERSRRIAQLQELGLILAVIVIVIEAVVIFLPAQLATRRAFDELEREREKLKAAVDSESAKSKQLEALRSTAEHDALHDPLTGLANRRYLEREVKRRAKEAQAADHGVAVLHIDLDRFKQINDSFGHAAGDYVLTHVAETLRAAARENDFVARIGGDEFVLLTQSDGERRRLEVIAQRIIVGLSQPLNYEENICRLGASVGIDIGIAEISGADQDAMALLSNADIALYRAKELGRGQFVFYCEELRAEVDTQRSLSDEISLAITKGEFYPLYQPQICAKTGSLLGVEALARWRHPTRGIVGPAQFLPVADRMGITAQIDELILEAALRDLRAWDEIGLAVRRLSVNISARRLRSSRLGQHLLQLDIPRERLSFEILETAFTDVIDDELGANLDLITDLGISVEVDDFGTGHSSLASIIAIAPARLKIARELVAPLPMSEAHKLLISSILDIARALNIEVVAEGVETAAQDAMLTDLGCEVLQGYHFAKPMTGEALIASVRAGTAWRARENEALSA